MKNIRTLVDKILHLYVEGHIKLSPYAAQSGVMAELETAFPEECSEVETPIERVKSHCCAMIASVPGDTVGHDIAARVLANLEKAQDNKGAEELLRADIRSIKYIAERLEEMFTR